MSRQSRLDWFASRALSPTASRRPSRQPRIPHRRPLRFEPLEDRRLLALTVTTLVDYGSKETRDAALATGMTDGMEQSYQLLDRLLEDPAGI